MAAGIPTRKRRVLAFVIDFCFSLFTISSVDALIPLWLEAVRTAILSRIFSAIIPLTPTASHSYRLYFSWL